MSPPEVAALRLGDPPAAWTSLGFSASDGVLGLGGVTIELGAEGRGIVAWRVRGIEPGDLDGLSTEELQPGGGFEPHANGALGVDHVVVLTPRFDRTAAALSAAGLVLRRVRTAPGGFRQGFRRLGTVILEVVETLDQPDGPAHFWGLVVTVGDLDALAARLGEKLGAIKPAVQPGRRIATLRPSAGLGEAVAFMSPELR